MFPGAFQMNIISKKKYEGWYAFREMNGICDLLPSRKWLHRFIAHEASLRNIPAENVNRQFYGKITIFYQADIGMWAIEIFPSQNIELRYVAYSAQILPSWPWHF